MRYWHIEGYDSLTKIYDRKVKIGDFSEKQLYSLLMALTAKASLNFDEILGAYASKRSKISNNLLFIQRGLYPVVSCGENPHFIARVIDIDE